VREREIMYLSVEKRKRQGEGSGGKRSKGEEGSGGKRRKGKEEKI
jgi:hypothetical protein